MEELGSPYFSEGRTNELDGRKVSKLIVDIKKTAEYHANHRVKEATSHADHLPRGLYEVAEAPEDVLESRKVSECLHER